MTTVTMRIRSIKEMVRTLFTNLYNHQGNLWLTHYLFHLDKSFVIFDSQLPDLNITILESEDDDEDGISKASDPQPDKHRRSKGEHHEAKPEPPTVEEDNEEEEHAGRDHRGERNHTTPPDANHNLQRAMLIFVVLMLLFGLGVCYIKKQQKQVRPAGRMYGRIESSHLEFSF